MYILFTLLMSFAQAEQEKILVESIAKLCFMENTTNSEKEACAMYMVNCTIKSGGKWTDKGLFACFTEGEKNGFKIYDGS